MNLIYVIYGLAPKQFQTNYFIGRQEEKVPSDQRQVQSEQDVENPHAYGHLGACCQIRPIAVKAKGGMKVNETIQAVSHQSHQLAAWINPMMSCPNLNEVSQRQTMKLNKRKTLRPRAPKSSMATTKAAGSSLSWRSLKPNCAPAKKTWATQTHIGSQHLVDTPNPIASRVSTAACAQLWHSCFQMIIFLLWSHQHCHHFGQAGQSSFPFCWASASSVAFFFASKRALASFTSFRSRSCMIRSVSRQKCLNSSKVNTRSYQAPTKWVQPFIIVRNIKKRLSAPTPLWSIEKMWRINPKSQIPFAFELMEMDDQFDAQLDVLNSLL